jgi:hypothetical protein
MQLLQSFLCDGPPRLVRVSMGVVWGARYFGGFCCAIPLRSGPCSLRLGPRHAWVGHGRGGLKGVPHVEVQVSCTFIPSSFLIQESSTSKAGNVKRQAEETISAAPLFRWNKNLYIQHPQAAMTRLVDYDSWCTSRRIQIDLSTTYSH